jgi:hypothetical protein
VTDNRAYRVLLNVTKICSPLASALQSGSLEDVLEVIADKFGQNAVYLILYEWTQCIVLRAYWQAKEKEPGYRIHLLCQI